MSISLQAIDLPSNGPWPPVPAPSMNLQSWAQMLHLAHRHGAWRPTRALPRLADFGSFTGTLATGGAVGEYGAGSAFDRAEAEAFGTALIAALEDVPRTEVAGHKLTMDVGVPLPKAGTRIDPAEWFSGEPRRALVHQVAQYALFGPFTVGL